MPAIRDWTYSYNTSSATSTAFVPQYQENDLIILAVSSNYANSNVSVTGFTNLFGRAIVGNTSLQHNSLHVLYKIAGASESDYTVRFGTGIDGFNQGVNSSTVQCISVRDVNTTTPFNGTGQSAFTAAGHIVPTSPPGNGNLIIYPAGRTFTGTQWNFGGNVYLGDAVTGSGVTAGTVITGFGITVAASIVNHNNGSATITVTGAPTGHIAPGQIVRNVSNPGDIIGNVTVVAQLTSTATGSALGGAGTYLLSQPSTSGANRTGQTYHFWATGGPGVYLVNNSQTVGGAPPSDVAITITHPTGISSRINGNVWSTGYNRGNVTAASGTQPGLLGSSGGNIARPGLTWPDSQGFRGQVAPLTTTVNNSLVLFINSSAGLSVAQVLEGNCTFESANDGLVTSLGYSWTMKRTAGSIGGPADYIFYNQIVPGNVSPGIIATIGISPPSGGATVIPTYCVADNSDYIDPLQGTLQYNNNSVFSPTPNTTTNYFSNITLGGAGILGAGGTSGTRVIVASAPDVGLHPFHSMANLNIAAPATGFYQGMGMQLDHPNRFSLAAGTGFEAGKQLLLHIKPNTPRDYQSTDNITKTIANGGRGVLVGLGSNVALMTVQIGAGVLEGIMAVSTKSTSGNLTVGTVISGTGIIANTAVISTEPVFSGAVIAVGGIATNGVTWTVTTTLAPVNWIGGQNVIIAGVTPTAYNGSYTIATGGTNTFTITNSAQPGAVTVAGTARGTVSTTGNGLGWYKINNSTAVASTPNIIGITSKLYHLHGAGTKWNVAQHAPLVIHPNYIGSASGNAIVQSNASLDTTQISHIGTFASGFNTTINYHIGTAWAIGNVIISGGNAAEPVNLSGIQKAASQGKERQSVLINGASQILCLQPIQFGDGGTNPIFLDINSTSIQFPRQYNQANTMVYYASIDNAAGITYYAGTGDTIRHADAIISSINKYSWGFHPSTASSTLATYDFTGTTVSGAGNIILNQNVDLTSVSFTGCDQVNTQLSTSIPRLRSCVFSKTTASIAGHGAITVAGTTMDGLQGQVNKLINCQYNTNTNSGGGALRLRYTGSAIQCNVFMHNQFFSSNSYDIYWDAPANTPLNLRYADMAVFTGQISGTTLTVSLSKTGYVFPDMILSGSGITGGTAIVTQLSGTNGREGTYTVSVSQTVSAGSTIYASGTRMTNPPTTYQASNSNIVTFQNKKMFVISNVVDGSNIKIYDQATVTQLAGSGVNRIGAVPVGLGADSAVATDPDNAGRYILSYEYTYSSDTPIYVVVIQTGYQAIRSTYTLTNMSSVLKVSQVIDRQYSNP